MPDVSGARDQAALLGGVGEAEILRSRPAVLIAFSMGPAAHRLVFRLRTKTSRS